MRKMFMVPAACLVLAAGCASTGQMRKVEDAGLENQKLLRETDQRLQNLERNVAALNSQVGVLNNRVYEVRTRNGRKTGMTVVPIIPPQPLTAAVNNAPPPPGHTPDAMPASRTLPAQAAQMDQTARNGRNPQSAALPADREGPSAASARAINPAAPPTPFPGNRAEAHSGADKAPGKADAASRKSGVAGPSGQVGRPDRVAGPSGQLASTEPAPAGLALPPADAPSAPAARSGAAATPGDAAKKEASASPAASPNAPNGGASGNAAVQVPSLPPSDLALPPAEAPAADAGASSAPAANAPASPAAADKPAAAPKAVKGEDAAYKAALKVALSGRPAEGITRFREFLRQYPHGRYAANAEYWIGECFYAQGKLQEALAQFQKVNAEYPRHHKNADALLKAGMCLSRLGDKQAAAQKYKTLLSDFPNSEAARLARSRGLAR